MFFFSIFVQTSEILIFKKNATLVLKMKKNHIIVNDLIKQNVK